MFDSLFDVVDGGGKRNFTELAVPCPRSDGHWHLLMAAYSLVRLDPDSSALGTVRSKASSLRANLEHSLKEAVYNLLSWVRDNDDRGVDDLMEEIDHLFVHSTADVNVQS